MDNNINDDNINDDNINNDNINNEIDNYELNTYYYILPEEFNRLEINKYGKSLLYPNLFFNYTICCTDEYKIYISDYSNIEFVKSIANKTVTIDKYTYSSLAINTRTGLSKKYPEYIFTINSGTFDYIEVSILTFQ